MANELKQSHSVLTDTLYATIRNAAGQILRISTRTFEVYGGGAGRTKADYAIAAEGDGGGWWFATMPALAAGLYYPQFFIQAGDVPADSDLPKEPYPFNWSGVKEIIEYDDGSRHLCLLADVKTRLGQTSTDFDEIINSIIDGVDGMFETYVNRPLLMTDDDVIENYGADKRWRRLLMNRYPIISVTSIKEADNYDFAAAIALVENTDYRLVNKGLKGIILRVDTDWLAGEDIIEVVYRGGYCGANEAASQGEYALPVELREAAITQACFMFKRKDDIGLSALSEQRSSITKFADMELLPMVKQILDDPKYKRPSL